jgi:hypothetical protein
MKTLTDEQRPEINESLPWFPDRLPFWRRVLCLLGYHRPVRWVVGPKGKFPGMRLRDKCEFCDAPTE